MIQKVLRKISGQWSDLRSHYFISSVDREFMRLNQAIPLNASAQKKFTILVQMPESYCELILFSSLIRKLKENYRIHLKWINVNNSFQRAGKLSFLKRNRFFERRWTSLYLSHGGEVVFSHLFYPSQLKPEWVNYAHQAMSEIKTKDDLLAFSLDGVRVGDLIYDTYLRYKPAATVNLEDPFLKEIIVAAAHIRFSASEYFSKNQVDFLLTSYGSYIHHGIMVRTALQQGVKVFSLGSMVQIVKEIRPEFPFHVKDYFHYPEIFKTLSESEQKQAQNIAKTALEKRFSGVKDQGMYYMSSSAFGAAENSGTVFKNNGKKRVVVFLHCFFDSPHEYRKMLYPDFYEWIRRTLEIMSSQDDYDVYVKQHPNGAPGNEEIVEELKALFPKVTFIPKNENNLKLIQEGFDLAVTVHGTLGHEYPYFGIPVLNAGDNPHTDYSFCIHPQTKQDYENYLKNIGTISKPTSADKGKIHEFYYMHNVHRFPGMLTPDETAFVNENSRNIRWEEDFAHFVQKCKNPDFVHKLDELVYRSFQSIF